MSKEVIIGLDGGATKIRGAIVELDENGLALDCKTPYYEVIYRDISEFNTSFVPIPLAIQLQQFQAQHIELSDAEVTQGDAIIHAAVSVIEKILESSFQTKEISFPSILLGIGMPGLKTLDKLGIAVMANGPRIPEYGIKLAKKLQERGISLVSSISGLGSDADYCGIGENLSHIGKLKDIETGYYIGIGTGIADAMKIAGKMVTFDEAKPWIAKSWEILASPGITMEKIISMSGIWQAFQNRHPEFSEGHAGIIFELAENGNTTARNFLAEIAQHFARLIYDRIHTLAVGNTTLNFSNTTRNLTSQHPYLGMTWQRIIIGQRMGHIWENKNYSEFFQNKVIFHIKNLIEKLPQEICKYYQNNLEKIIVASPLDHAPILGAAITAYHSYKKC